MDGNSNFFVLSNAFGPNNQKMVWPAWIFLFEHLRHPTVSIHYLTFKIMVNKLATLNIITVSIGFTGLKSPDTQSSEAAFDETTCLLQEIDGIMGELNMKYITY